MLPGGAIGVPNHTPTVSAGNRIVSAPFGGDAGSGESRCYLPWYPEREGVDGEAGECADAVESVPRPVFVVFAGVDH